MLHFHHNECSYVVLYQVYKDGRWIVRGDSGRTTGLPVDGRKLENSPKIGITHSRAAENAFARRWCLITRANLKQVQCFSRVSANNTVTFTGLASVTISVVPAFSGAAKYQKDHAGACEYLNGSSAGPVEQEGPGKSGTAEGTLRDGLWQQKNRRMVNTIEPKF
ncbi:hypothetical protein BC937DRAFT_91056 [Endogone sp. FLAS-F59071]|nr:hypothetical protein BC937DRAFT_91056 [Endogone sp. FLAS-F59071]|eukprot:RUS16578.1 hypothetical protein BC937DRAFT_91056 [Endogone sp. FLAS-F59071]